MWRRVWQFGKGRVASSCAAARAVPSPHSSTITPAPAASHAAHQLPRILGGARDRPQFAELDPRPGRVARLSAAARLPQDRC